VEGKELWEKKVKKAKLHINEDELTKFVHMQKINNTQEFYLGIRTEDVDPDVMIGMLLEKAKRPPSEQDQKGDNGASALFNKFVKSARSITSGISLFGTHDNFMHNYAKCCNPIPGDEIVGFITTGEGLKIHRKNCRNVASLRLNDEERIVEVSWPPTEDIDFIAGIKLSGEDRSGLLNEITHAISTFENTNIRSVNIATKDSLFDGQFILYVKNTQHLSGIVDRLKRLKGVTKVERFEDANG
jgi:(p)ppGpp synthase/HD superfamily hydrolase